MRISDWSSDVCSSDLVFQQHALGVGQVLDPGQQVRERRRDAIERIVVGLGGRSAPAPAERAARLGDTLCRQGRYVPCPGIRSEEHTSELQSLMRTSYAVFCLKKKK